MRRRLNSKRKVKQYCITTTQSKTPMAQVRQIHRASNSSSGHSQLPAFTNSCEHYSSPDYQQSNSTECMWTNFKAAITSAVDKYVPTKMSNTRQTHPWVDTKLHRLMRQKQRAHWIAKKTRKEKHWRRYKDLQKRAQTTSRQTERIYLQKVVSEDLDKNPRCFWSYIKRRKQENEGVSSLINKDGFLQSDSQKKSDKLNILFQRRYQQPLRQRPESSPNHEKDNC